MKRAREKRDRPAAAVGAATAAAADTVAVAKVAAREEATDEFANNGSGRVFGQGWIRTSEGVSQQIYSLPPLATWVTYHT